MRLIDADELIESIKEELWHWDTVDGINATTVLKQTISDINNMPSAQPERKRGEWEFYEDRSPVWDIAGEKTWARAYKCSECGFVHAVIEDFGIYQYCPQCGADMREDNHETD